MPTKQPKLVTRTVRLDALQPWPRNYREHPPQQVEAIAASLNTFTQVKNIVCVERDGVPFVVGEYHFTEGGSVRVEDIAFWMTYLRERGDLTADWLEPSAVATSGYLD